ncbi:hypothetical protein Sj15T_05590 [Sphingobium sp. TA15]|uniref:2-nitropropane dioxygenase family protein n=1 Tax=Sphingobium indicum (strain DSM 16413 / CCM 7287 / MTCC 6362 / UT26 / NBRC 101211 / UT26S) TaxID=452662 RepID=D4Z0V5_SPHIU|nr:nitronate monooxygenase [Sphingobium indicum]BAI96237.1 2-nitropropane dioxygenase family protein [Sphingobium indicum UT26S]BDD65538.1 hypothetical protein Sj15T_05590 [Sphingobium sp. TA15]
MDRYGSSNLASELRERLSVPVVVAPMFLVSTVDMVIEANRAGAIGSIPALNARTTAIFAEWVQQIGAATTASGRDLPWAVNLIVHSTNTRLEADLEVCIAAKVPAIIASVGSPAIVIERVRAYGGLVFSDAASIKHARRAAQAGVDGLILLTAGAGGNTGWLNPFAFVAEVRKFFDGPIVLAGGISNGRSLAAARMLGADMAAVGTSFIAAEESAASADYRQMLVESDGDDIILTSEVTGIPSNMLRASLERSGFVSDGKHEKFDLARELETVKAWRDVWAGGHGVGDVTRSAPIAHLLAELGEQYREALRTSVS